MKSNYEIPADAIEHVLEIKKSAFIARVHHCDSKEMAKNHLQQARDDYPDARHHCWAYLLGHPQRASSAAMSDDGEPSGTAGKPILNVLNHSNLGDVMVIVIRYFGGIKLGAGGLVRAYSQATQQAIDITPRTEQVTRRAATLTFPYSEEQDIRHLLNTHNGLIMACEYLEEIRMDIEFPLDDLSTLRDFVSGRHRVLLKESNE